MSQGEETRQYSPSLSWSESDHIHEGLQKSNTFELPEVLEKATEIGTKVVIKAGMNTFVPGSGSLVEFPDAARNFSEGKTTSGLINLGCAMADAISLGVIGVAKDVISLGAIGVAKDIVKDIAKDTVKDIAVNSGKQAMLSITEEAYRSTGLNPEGVANDFCKNITESMTEKIVEESVKEATKLTARPSMETLAETVVSSGGQDVSERLCCAGVGLMVRKVVEMGKEAASGVCMMKADQELGLKCLDVASTKEMTDEIIGKARDVSSLTQGSMAVAAGVLRYNSTESNNSNKESQV